MTHRVQCDGDTRVEFSAAVRCEDADTLPTYANQLLAAQQLLKTQGPSALDNPHAMIGLQCKCRNCFCCAALEVLREYKGTAGRHE